MAVCHNGAEVILAVNILYSGLDIVFMVEPYHHAGLVETHLVIA